VNFDTKSILKLRYDGQTNIAMYLGLKYSFDGVSFLIGMKVGAIKMIFPILVMHPENGKNSKPTDLAPSEESDNISILCAYLVS